MGQSLSDLALDMKMAQMKEQFERDHEENIKRVRLISHRNMDNLSNHLA